MPRLSAIFLSCLALAACGRPDTLVERIKHGGELIVVTRNAATTYYEGPDGPAGLEYDLAALFAEHLGVRVARKHIGWYSKGSIGGSSFRRTINQMETPAEQRALIETFFAQQAELSTRLAA